MNEILIAPTDVNDLVSQFGAGKLTYTELWSRLDQSGLTLSIIAPPSAPVFKDSSDYPESSHSGLDRHAL